MDRKIFGNVLKIFSAEGVSLAMGYLLVLTVAYILGDEGVGRYGVVVGWALFLSIAADMGLTSLILREGSAEKEKIKQYFEQVTFLRIIVITLFLVVGAFFYNLGGNFLLLSFALFLASTNIINDFLRGAFIGLELHGNAAKLRIAERLLFVIIGSIVLYLTNDIFLMFTAVIFTNILIIIPGIMLLTRHTPFLSRKIISREISKRTLPVFRETFSFWVMNVLGRSQRLIDIVMLQFITNLSIVGWYTAGQSIIEALSFIPITIAISLLPTISRLYKAGKEKELKAFFHRIYYYALLLALPILVGLILVAEPLIAFIFPPELAPAATVIQIMSFSLFLFFLNVTTGTFLNAIRKSKLVATAVAGSLVVNVVSNAFAIPIYEHIGAATATVLSRAFVFVFFFIVLYKTPYGISLRQLGRYAIKPIIACLAMVPVVLYTLQFHLIAGLISGVITYLGVIFLIKGINTDDLREVVSIIRDSFSTGRKLVKRRVLRQKL